MPAEAPLRYFTVPEDGLYEGMEIVCIGKADKLIVKNKYRSAAEGSNDKRPVFQGRCAILSKDGHFLHEGYFKDGKRFGPQRIIKLSKRKPGHYLIREGKFSAGVESEP